MARLLFLALAAGAASAAQPPASLLGRRLWGDEATPTLGTYYPPCPTCTEALPEIILAAKQLMVATKLA
jgi:hypothetical protein